MDRLRHVVCASCNKQLGKEEDVLMCGGCKIWQHKQCSRGVDPSFYSKFYLAVAQEQKPVHWQCDYCSKHQASRITMDDVAQDKGQKKKYIVIPSVSCVGGGHSRDSVDEPGISMKGDSENEPGLSLKGISEEVGPALQALKSKTTSQNTVFHGFLSNPQIVLSVTKGSQGNKQQQNTPKGIPTIGSQCKDLDGKPQIIITGSHGNTMQKKTQDKKPLQGIPCSLSPILHQAPIQTDSPIHAEHCNWSTTETESSDSDTMEPPAKHPRLTKVNNSDGTVEKPKAPIANTVTQGEAISKSTLADSLGYTYQNKSNFEDRVIPASHNYQSSHPQKSTKTNSASHTVVRNLETPECQQVFQKTTALHASNQAQEVKPAAPVQKKTTDCQQVLKETTTAAHPSNQAPTVKPTAPVQKTTTPSNPEDNAPPMVSTKPAPPTDTQSATYQEITTCTPNPSRSQSALIDEDGYIYKAKLEKGCTTTWKCTHKGQNGQRCTASIFQDYIRKFNADESADYVWLANHGPDKIHAEGKHNHEADRTAAYTFKIKAMIHKQIFGNGFNDLSPDGIIEMASQTMLDHENDYELRRQQMKMLKSYVWRLQKVHRNMSRAEQDRYMLDWMVVCGIHA